MFSIGQEIRMKPRISASFDVNLPPGKQAIAGKKWGSLLGGEDSGGISAFVVFLKMGFYPITPRVPIYDLASQFLIASTSVYIMAKPRKLFAGTIRRTTNILKAFDSMAKPLNQAWFRHADIVNGGTLEIQMGNPPNEKLGADPAGFPTSETELNPVDF
jgi:putative alpha-1,2-mannosidase